MPISPRRLVVLALAVVSSLGILASPRSAQADIYLGLMPGYGIPMGTSAELDSGFAYGATLGVRLLPMLAVAGTYLHDGWETKAFGIDYDVDQYLLEANFFSMLGLTAGLHGGSVSTDIGGFSESNLGFGVHAGFDFPLTERMSIGGAGYWTYVTADDKFAVLNLMVPVKFSF